MFYGQPSEADLKVAATEYSEYSGLVPRCGGLFTFDILGPQILAADKHLHLLEFTNFDIDTAMNTEYSETCLQWIQCWGTTR